MGCSADPVLQAAEAGQGADARGLPLWARWDARNFRNTVITTSDQYVILVEVASGQQSRAPPVVMEGIGDTGATRSLMDLETARRVGLQIEVAHGSEFGTYFGPGSKERPYAGRVVGPVVLRFGKEVQLELRELKLIHHSEPLLLIGADVLCGGRAGWTYRAMGVGAAGKGMIIFANGKRTVSLPLVNAPRLGRPRFVSPASATSAAMVASAPEPPPATVSAASGPGAPQMGRR